MVGEWKRFASHFDAATKGLDADDIADYIDAIYDDMAQLRDVSPKLNRQAHCMMLYGAFENGLSNMCRLVHHHQFVTGKLPKNLHMDTIKTFLAPHISKRAWGKEWQWMDELRIVRNAFAHAAGRIERQIDKNTKEPIPGFRLKCP